MFRLVVVALIVSAVGGRKFQNPVIEGGPGYYRPSVILHAGQYYAVTSTRLTETNKFPIYVSSDLQNWHEVGYALLEGYIPEWINDMYWSPQIHQIGENDFRLFFYALNSESRRVMGVGVSQTVFGPYVVQKEPLQLDLIEHSYDPTLVQDGLRKYLVWEGTGGLSGREMNPDCLDFIPGSIQEMILASDLPWEGGQMRGPWYVRRPDAWYLFYSAGSECTEYLAVGVARSLNPLGPFEKRGDPILTTSDAFKGPGHCSVVPDIYTGSTVMVYQATKSGNDMCSAEGAAILSQSVEWGDDGWPVMIPY